MNSNTIQNPIAVFHLAGPPEITGFITDQAENDGDMQRAMITE
jgi:hypothetical protein